MNLLPDIKSETATGSTPLNLLPDLVPDEATNPTPLHPMEMVDKFNKFIQGTRLPEAAGGLLQTTGDTAASVANIAPELINAGFGTNVPRVPHPDLEKYIPQDDASKTAFGGGELGGYLIPGTAVEKFAAKGLTALPGVIASPLAGAAAGAAIGENKDETGRALGAVAGGAGNSLLDSLKGGYQMMARPLANEIVKAKNAVVNRYNALYDDLFNEAETRGLSDLPFTQKKGLRTADGTITDLPKGTVSSFGKYDRFLANATKNEKQSYQDFLDEPTLENAHWAQSDLGKYIRKKTKINNQTGLMSDQLEGLNQADSLQQEIRDLMSSHLRANGHDDLADAYSELTKNYGDDVIPYTKNSDIRKYQNKEISADRLVTDLGKTKANEEFMLAKGKDHPNIARRAALRKLLQSKLARGAAIGAGATALGLPIGYKLFGNGNNN